MSSRKGVVARVIAAAVVSRGAALSITQARPVEVSTRHYVDVDFSDATRWRFHAAWLRDACRDDAHVARAAGERILTSTPVGPLGYVDPGRIHATGIEVGEDGGLAVRWSEGTTEASRFEASMLREYASRGVAQLLDGADGEPRRGWLEAYTGFPDAPAASFAPFDGSWSPPTFEFEAAIGDPETLARLHEAVLLQGAAMIVGCPDDSDDPSARVLAELVAETLGGLQKDPTRAESNWKIVKKADASSISYDPAKRLYQHTDASIPPHGVPGLALSMHYKAGSGANTLTDGFAVAQAILDDDPDAFRLLATYGYDATRDFKASRVDSTQDIAKGFVVDRKHPIFHLAGDGRSLQRIQYNEVFRTPPSLPFDAFPDWYAALSKFASLVHDPAFECEVDMAKGNVLLMNNWRVLHGRPFGKASPNRHLVGGTITRESLYSRANQLQAALRRDPSLPDIPGLRPAPTLP